MLWRSILVPFFTQKTSLNRKPHPKPMLHCKIEILTLIVGRLSLEHWFRRVDNC